ncbi:HNH endonuclease signature motif containing protein [Paracoccus mutanolyticus]|uniref:HNH endonuclease signature motif containing protein n=1 Tax=Paracoccus mutanolyticus TaxID=1499308 RepID=UPI001CB94A3E|nr:HNH endonuclease [Paracoccus mutanolyticus]
MISGPIPSPGTEGARFHPYPEAGTGRGIPRLVGEQRPAWLYADWEKARAEFVFSLHSCCVMCGADATLVDHIKPHRGDKALFWNWNNWQALCTSVKQRDAE